MKVFISWSGDRSKVVARELAEFLTDVIQTVRTFMSGHDLEAGARWPLRLMGELDKTDFGILCLTPENLDSRWIHFETGALSKRVDASGVCPYLFGGLTPTQVPWPLAQFQSNLADKEGTLNILKAINERIGDNRLADSVLTRAFNRCWPEMEVRLKAVPSESPTAEPSKTLSDVEKLDEVLKLLRARDGASAPQAAVPFLSSPSLEHFVVTVSPIESLGLGATLVEQLKVNYGVRTVGDLCELSYGGLCGTFSPGIAGLIRKKLAKQGLDIND
jgi:TIR domain